MKEIAKFLVGNGRECKIVDVSFVKKMDLKVISPVKDLTAPRDGSSVRLLMVEGRFARKLGKVKGASVTTPLVTCMTGWSS